MAALLEELEPLPSFDVQREWLGRYCRTMLALPLISKDHVYGGIVLYFLEPRSFDKDELELAVAYADQAALAIANATLRAQAEEMAVAAERNRLARDLHDAVTQTLFSASLIADVVPRIWERSPEAGMKRLDELKRLTKGALAEMRTLLFELRPSTLTGAALEDLLKQQAEVASGHAGIPVSLEVEGKAELPEDVKIVFYRIAQEALNNISKHSQASAASISLKSNSGATEMIITDDGTGFDPSVPKPGHLGLGIMKERAETVGAVFELSGYPGEGTRISVCWDAADQI
ncbi:MAG: GAF domain-containing sensor histidine kinase [Clostridiales bacterium]|nr:GAF domain-containing sensor histidine kinase [Clostridiales bacterium]